MGICVLKRNLISNKLVKRFRRFIAMSLFKRNKIRRRGFYNKISNNKSLLVNSKLILLGNNNLISIGADCCISNYKFFIKGNNNRIIILDNCNLKGGELWIEDDNNLIQIGEGTTIETNVHFAATEGYSIIIGKDCMFSHEVVIRTGDSHSILNMEGNRINKSKDIIIGNHCWFGHRSIILKGASIPSNSIIGTSALVNKTFEAENSIITGIPAHVIKNDVKWLRERIQ